MKFEITNDVANDSFVVSGDTIKELQQTVKIETEKRNWKPEDCWSKELK